MPIKLSHLIMQRRSLSVDYAGETVELAYNANMVNFRTITTLQQLATKPELIIPLISELVLAWDVVDELGAPLPLREGDQPADVLWTLPVSFLGDIVAAIVRDASPNPPSAGTSGAG